MLARFLKVLNQPITARNLFSHSTNTTQPLKMGISYLSHVTTPSDISVKGPGGIVETSRCVEDSLMKTQDYELRLKKALEKQPGGEVFESKCVEDTLFSRRQEVRRLKEQDQQEFKSVRFK